VRRRLWNPPAKSWTTFITSLFCCALAGAQGQAGERRALQLEVLYSGETSGLIGAFSQEPDGEMWARGAELEELGLKIPAPYKPNDEVPLTAFPGLAYNYDEMRQIIDLDVDPTQRLPKIYDALALPAPMPPSVPTTGAVLNYLLFGGAGSTGRLTNWQVQGVSATLDARFFSPFGVISQSGILSSNAHQPFISQRLRLNTTWTYTDPSGILIYRAGDTISGALAWTRPIRLGGLQVQRDFTLRPDLVTIPLPTVDGSAAVPTTVDVYVNNIKTASQDVGNGPFSITNLPIFSGRGDASVVLHDPSGREVVTSLPFFVSNRLLRQGLYDFSLEAGFPRLYYGARSNVYARSPAGSFSLRFGLTDHITIEAHAEGTTGLLNGGLGMVAGIDQIGLVSAAIAASDWRGFGDQATPLHGAFAYLGFDTTINGLTLSIATQRSFSDYADLAYVTAPLFDLVDLPPVDPLGFGTPALYFQNSFISSRPPLEQDRLFVGFPLPFTASSVNLGLARVKYRSAQATTIATASYSQQVFGNGSLIVSAFTDIDHRKNSGFFVGFSIALGNDVRATTATTLDRSGSAIGGELTKPLRPEPGSVGWQIRDTEGRAGQRLGRFAYRGEKGLITLTAAQSRLSGFYGTATAEGAIVIAEGDTFLSNRIDDSFAIVDAGAPDLDVFFENRPVARTGAKGKALVPTLRANQPNKISIDPRHLPLDASIAMTQEVLSPPRRSGVKVDFGIKTGIPSAIVILHGADGQPLRAGLRGNLASGQSFIVGYDGRAYVEGLEPINLATVALANGGECRTEFAYVPKGEPQLVIGPLECL
jgi:outer membrane usher protein